MTEPGSSLSPPSPKSSNPTQPVSLVATVDVFGTPTRRCQAHLRGRTKQCGRPAMKGAAVCRLHGGVALAKRGKRTHSLYSKYLSPEEVRVYRKALKGEGNSDEIALLVAKVAGYVKRATDGDLKVDDKSLELLSQILVRLGNLREQDIRMAGMKSGKLDASGRAPTQVQINVIWGGKESEIIEGEVVDAESREISPAG